MAQKGSGTLPKKRILEGRGAMPREPCTRITFPAVG